MYQKRDNPNGAGRKGTYKKSFAAQAYKLALLGATDKQLADFFEVHITTIDYWKQQKPDFMKALKKGKVEADSNVAAAFYKRAVGYSHPDVHIMANRVTEYDGEGKVIKEYTKPLIIPITKHYPPDSFACLKWLSLRQKEQWTDSQKIEITNNTNLNIAQLSGELSDTTKYSTDELRMALKIGVIQVVKNQQSINQTSAN